MNSHTILGRWYIKPLTTTEAQKLLDECTQRLGHRLRHGGNTLCCRLGQMVAQFWLGRQIRDHYHSLLHLAARSAHGRALLELIYGQLLLTRRQSEGLKHLDKGFRLAANLFSAEDYLQVMNRHRLLHQLPLSSSPVAPETLESLLITAKVIERMAHSIPATKPVFRHDPSDTDG